MMMRMHGESLDGLSLSWMCFDLSYRFWIFHFDLHKIVLVELWCKWGVMMNERRAKHDALNYPKAITVINFYKRWIIERSKRSIYKRSIYKRSIHKRRNDEFYEVRITTIVLGYENCFWKPEDDGTRAVGPLSGSSEPRTRRVCHLVGKSYSVADHHESWATPVATLVALTEHWLVFPSVEHWWMCPPRHPKRSYFYGTTLHDEWSERTCIIWDTSLSVHFNCLVCISTAIYMYVCFYELTPFACVWLRWPPRWASRWCAAIAWWMVILMLLWRLYSWARASLGYCLLKIHVVCIVLM